MSEHVSLSKVVQLWTLTQGSLVGRRALLHNLATDETLMTFANASGAGTTTDLYSNSNSNPAAAAGGACTAISFRTGALSTAVPIPAGLENAILTSD